MRHQPAPLITIVENAWHKVGAWHFPKISATYRKPLRVLLLRLLLVLYDKRVESCGVQLEAPQACNGEPWSKLYIYAFMDELPTTVRTNTAYLSLLLVLRRGRLCDNLQGRLLQDSSTLALAPARSESHNVGVIPCLRARPIQVTRSVRCDASETRT